MSFCQIELVNIEPINLSAAGLLNSLVDTRNLQAGSYEILRSTSNGKKKTVVVRHVSPATASEVVGGTYSVDGEFAICSHDNAIFVETENQIDQYAAIGRRLPYGVGGLAEICEGRNEAVNRILASMAQSLIQVIEGTLVQRFNALRGNTSAGTTTPIATTAFVGGVASDAYRLDIMDEFFKLQIANTTPVLVGGSVTNRYANAIGIGCCNDNGQNVQSFMSDILVYKSNSILDTLASPALVFPLGDVQLLSWTRNEGDFRMDNELAFSGTIELPLSNGASVVLDLDIIRTPCSKAWDITLSKSFDLLMRPASYFPVGHQFAGVNYGLGFVPAV